MNLDSFLEKVESGRPQRYSVNDLHVRIYRCLLLTFKFKLQVLFQLMQE